MFVRDSISCCSEYIQHNLFNIFAFMCLHFSVQLFDGCSDNVEGLQDVAGLVRLWKN